MRNPSQPDTQQDEYLPDNPKGHKTGRPTAEPDAISPLDTSSMPRAEDDDKTKASSPEFNDRTDVGDAGTAPAPPNATRR